MTNLVKSIAHRYKRILNESHYEDLIQEGLIAEWEASKTYNPNRGSTLKTWSYIWIKGALLRYITRECKQPKYALNQVDGHGDSAYVNEDKLLDDSQDPLHANIASETADRFQERLDSLTPRELEVFSQRFIDDSKPTLQQLALKLGVSQQRVSQIEAVVKSKLLS